MKGLGVAVLIALAVVGVRAVGVIDWPWWAVTAPLWVPAALLAVGVVAVMVTRIGARAVKS